MPTINGVDLDDGTHVPADEKIDGGPSVLFDAVALILTEDGAAKMAKKPPAKDFLNDAFAHYKYIGSTADSMKLFEAVGMADSMDEGCMELGKPASIKSFVSDLGKLRFWERDGGA